MKNTLLASMVISGIGINGATASEVNDAVHTLLGDTNTCKTTMSIEQRSKYRVNPGAVPVDGPVTVGYGEIACGNVDVNVWWAHNNNTGKMNEVDIGVGYALPAQLLPKDTSVRLALERFFFTETWGSIDVAKLQLGYTWLPIDVRFQAMKIIDGGGAEYSGTLSKTFDIPDVADWNLKLTPSVTSVYLDDFFGSDGVTNIKYWLTLSGSKDEGWGWTFKFDYHDGKQWRKNDVVISGWISKNF